VRLSAPYLKYSLKPALAYRAKILEHTIDEILIYKTENSNPYGENVKMARTITQKQKLLTPAEKTKWLLNMRAV
jgi:hypothetical protein